MFLNFCCVLLRWHTGLCEDSIDLELFDLMDGFIEELFDVSLDDLLCLEEIIDVISSA